MKQTISTIVNDDEIAISCTIRYEADRSTHASSNAIWLLSPRLHLLMSSTQRIIKRERERDS